MGVSIRDFYSREHGENCPNLLNCIAINGPIVNGDNERSVNNEDLDRHIISESRMVKVKVRENICQVIISTKQDWYIHTNVFVCILIDITIIDVRVNYVIYKRNFIVRRRKIAI